MPLSRALSVSDPQPQFLRFTVWATWGPPVSRAQGGAADSPLVPTLTETQIIASLSHFFAFVDSSSGENGSNSCDVLNRASVQDKLCFNLSEDIISVEIIKPLRGANIVLGRRALVDTLLKGSGTSTKPDESNSSFSAATRASSASSRPQSISIYFESEDDRLAAFPFVASSAHKLIALIKEKFFLLTIRKAQVKGPSAVRLLRADNVLWTRELQSNQAQPGGQPAAPTATAGGVVTNAAAAAKVASITRVRKGDVHLTLSELGREALGPLLDVDASYEWTLQIRNESTLDVAFVDIDVLSVPEFSLDSNIVAARREQRSTPTKKALGFMHSQSQRGLVLGAGERHLVTVRFRAKRYGTFRLHAVFKFSRGDQYYMFGPLQVGNLGDFDLLKPTQEYRACIQNRLHADQDDEKERKIVPAQPPASLFKSHRHTGTRTHWVVRLDEYPVPDRVQQDIYSVGHSSDSGGAAWQVKENFRPRMHHLMWVEESEHRKNMRQYDLTDVEIAQMPYIELPQRGIIQMEDSRPFARLNVPGLAEGRPSVLFSDSVYAYLPDSDTQYEGWVYRAERDHLVLVFFPGFFKTVAAVDSVTGAVPHFNVRFQPNRLQYRVIHRAIDLCAVDVAWPRAKTALPFVVSDAGWFDDGLDSQQRQAVTAFVQRPTSVPYLLFGPFGCGKTRTLVEIALQVVRSVRIPRPGSPSLESKLLIAAPSNSAADMICAALASELRESEMIRIHAFNRPKHSVRPVEVMNYSMHNERVGIFDIPPLDELLAFRVVVSTCSSAALLTSVGVPIGHFSHIFLDEAAQLMEAEALIPLTLAVPSQTAILLAGDDRQFGPIILSPSARLHRLHHSLMERLAKQSADIYQTKRGKGTWGSTGSTIHPSDVVTHLTTNYRVGSVDLIKIQSKLFYSDILVPSEATKAKRSHQSRLSSTLCSWRQLPNKTLPLLVAGIEGEDLREGDSPSFFNRLEASEVVRLIADLLQQFGGNNGCISGTDVGVVTPYRKQSEKIRQLLQAKGIKFVKVGTPREFQGHERPVLFVSSVRSMWRRWDMHDRRFHLGFINDAKQMCTTLSRAGSLLVLVCDPYNLSRDWRWRKVIDFAAVQRNYVGPALSESYFSRRAAKDIPLLNVDEELTYCFEETAATIDLFDDTTLKQAEVLDGSSKEGIQMTPRQHLYEFPKLPFTPSTDISAQNGGTLHGSTRRQFPTSGTSAPMGVIDLSNVRSSSPTAPTTDITSSQHRKVDEDPFPKAVSVEASPTLSTQTEAPTRLLPFLTGAAVLVPYSKQAIVTVLPAAAASRLHFASCISAAGSLEVRISLFGMGVIEHHVESGSEIDAGGLETVKSVLTLVSRAPQLDPALSNPQETLATNDAFSSNSVGALINICSVFQSSMFDLRALDISYGGSQFAISVPLKTAQRAILQQVAQSASPFVPSVRSGQPPPSSHSPNYRW